MLEFFGIDKRLLGRPRCRWEDNIKRDLINIECEGEDLLKYIFHKEINFLTR
jgi:hypothetical protein